MDRHRLGRDLLAVLNSTIKGRAVRGINSLHARSKAV